MILCNDDIFSSEGLFPPYERKIKDLKIVFLIVKVVTFFFKRKNYLFQNAPSFKRSVSAYILNGETLKLLVQVFGEKFLLPHSLFFPFIISLYPQQ